MHRYFDLAGWNTSYRQETLAGITTFLTMAYIIIVNPAILEAAGLPKGASVTATIISAAFGTLVMGVYAKRPFAIAPYMGENAFIAGLACWIHRAACPTSRSRCWPMRWRVSSRHSSAP